MPKAKAHAIHNDEKIAVSGENDQDNSEKPGSGSRRRGRGGGKSARGRGGNAGGRGRGRGRGKRGGAKTPAGRKDHDAEALGVIEEHQRAVQVASQCDVILVYFQYDIYDSVVPSSFIRSAPSMVADGGAPFSPRPFKTYAPDECLRIVATSEIGRGTTGVVHGGTLEVPIPGTPEVSTLAVVVKLAFRRDQRSALMKEYEFYRLLKSRRIRKGITTVLGIFDCCDPTGGPSALVMLNSGVALDKDPLRALSLSVPQCKSALSTLKSIHRAGILHNSIHPRNILMSDSGITIIDFGGSLHSPQSSDQRAQEKECIRLGQLLGPGKKK